jgi:hypothetical protein
MIDPTDDLGVAGDVAAGAPAGTEDFTDELRAAGAACDATGDTAEIPEIDIMSTL